MELAPEENVQVGTFLNEIASVAEFIAKMMSDNENLNTKVENLTIEKETPKNKGRRPNRPKQKPDEKMLQM